MRVFSYFGYQRENNMYNPKTNPISIFERILKDSHVGLIAIILICTACALWILGREVPQTLEYLTISVVSFYFGKVNSIAHQEDS